MNGIKIILLTVLIILLVLLTRSSTLRSQAWKKIFTFLFFIMAVIFVLFPDLSNRIANFVGVGRGADLLLYILTLAFVYVVISSYVKNQHENKKLIILARKIAVLEAVDKNGKSIK